MSAIRVGDEFGELRTALVHDGSNAIDVTMEMLTEFVPPAELAEHPESAPSRRDLLGEQHARFRQLLADEGVGLVSPDTRAAAFCQVFTRDPCFVVGDTLFAGGLRDEWRHPESPALGGLRALLPRVVDLSGAGALIEGGDVMVFDAGRRVLVGSNRHTNDAGFRRLADALPGAEVVRVPHRALHLDCCLAPLPDRGALYHAAVLPDASVELLGRYFDRLIPLDPDEAALRLAANVFWLDRRRVVSSLHAPRTNARLRGMGYEVRELDFSQLTALWGSFRCVVCPLLRG